MRIIGLTGSIGTGKSTTAAMCRRLGAWVYDSDAAVHALLSPRGKAFRDVAVLFPDAWDRKKHIINRKILGELVFRDDAARKKLENILHPHIWAQQKKFILKARRAGIRHVIMDIPLLFETNAQKRMDAVITVTAPYFLQRLRVLKRPHQTLEKFHAILRQQIPQILKARMSDYVIQTGLGQRFVLDRLKQILNK